jgi:hypothetical protein
VPASTNDTNVVIDDGDQIIWVSHLPGELREVSDDPPPKHRDLVQRANDAEIAPPMERFGRFWGCRRRNVPKLAEALGLEMKSPVPASPGCADTRARP